MGNRGIEGRMSPRRRASRCGADLGVAVPNFDAPPITIRSSLRPRDANRAAGNLRGLDILRRAGD